MISYQYPEWTSDGRYIACMINHYDESGVGWEGIRLIDPNSGEVISVMENDLRSDVRAIGFRNKTSISPDGQRILFCVACFDVEKSADGKPAYRNRRDILCWYDIPGRCLHEIMSTHPDEGDSLLYTGGYNWQPIWSPDGNRVLFTRGTPVEAPRGERRVPDTERLSFEMGASSDWGQRPTEPNLCVCEISV
jgi:Tol biopolymer transport system component